VYYSLEAARTLTIDGVEGGRGREPSVEKSHPSSLCESQFSEDIADKYILDIFGLDAGASGGFGHDILSDDGRIKIHNVRKKKFDMGILTGARISSGQASLNLPLNERVIGLRTADKTTMSLGDFALSPRKTLGTPMMPKLEKKTIFASNG
jgi:hypothetical protein